MPRPPGRLTLWRLMALVSVLGVGLAILRHARTYWGTGEVLTIAPTVLLATHFLACFQRARWRAFWLGFGLSGWAYLAISLGSPAGEFLPTTRLLDGLHGRLYPPEAFRSFEDDFAVPRVMRAPGHRFRGAGHSVFSLFIALLGGAGASVLLPTRCEDREEGLPPDGSLLNPRWRDQYHRL
jgi:hypothetical protein